MQISKHTLNFSETKFNKTLEFSLDLVIHPFNNGVVVINYPGAEGSIDGYEEKYVKIANHLVENNVAAVVRIPNPHTFGFGWDMNLRKALSFVLDNAKTICGSHEPKIYLMGFSAGAGAIAEIAWEYPEIKKILLMEPAIQYGEERVGLSMGKFQGETYIVVGGGEEALGEKVGKVFYDAAKCASKKEMFVIENCDHQFTGEKNGRILSQAPLYAFLDDPKIQFPNASGGIKLYD